MWCDIGDTILCDKMNEKKIMDKTLATELRTIPCSTNAVLTKTHSAESNTTDVKNMRDMDAKIISTLISTICGGILITSIILIGVIYSYYSIVVYLLSSGYLTVTEDRASGRQTIFLSDIPYNLSNIDEYQTVDGKYIYHYQVYVNYTYSILGHSVGLERYDCYHVPQLDINLVDIIHMVEFDPQQYLSYCIGAHSPPSIYSQCYCHLSNLSTYCLAKCSYTHIDRLSSSELISIQSDVRTNGILDRIGHEDFDMHYAIPTSDAKALYWLCGDCLCFLSAWMIIWILCISIICLIKHVHKKRTATSPVVHGIM